MVVVADTNVPAVGAVREVVGGVVSEDGGVDEYLRS